MRKKFKLNCALGGHAAGAEISLQCSKSGVPIDRFWRRRLNDSKIDNCMEKVKKTTKKRSDDT